MWQHIVTLIEDENLKDLAAQHNCTMEMARNPCPPGQKGHTGNYLTCLLDRREDIQNVACQAFIQRLEWVAFTDYKLIAPFADACKIEIDRYKCGRLQGGEVCITLLH